MKYILITGGNAGIGKQTAIELGRDGSTVVLACRNIKKAEDTAEEIKAATKNQEIYSLHCDLGSQTSVRSCAEAYRTQFGHLDILINNAGLITDKLQFTYEGYEMQIGVNHLGHFLLTQQLIDLLLASKEPRIINVSSKAHYKGSINFNTFKGELGASKYKGMAAYAQSKMANVLFTKELARRYPSITSHCLHPGVVGTSIAGKNDNSLLWKMAWKVFSPFMLSANQGAKTSIYLATSPDVLKTNGKYYHKCQEVQPAKLSQDIALSERLWIESEKMVNATF